MDRLQKNNKSVGEMEFLRFVFSIIIVLHHSRNFVGNKTSLFLNGAFAVEFFFILSGFLMMKSIRKIQTDPQNLGAETARFIKKKYLSLCPDMIISWIIGAAATAVLCNYTGVAIGTMLHGGIWELGLLTMTGIRTSTLNGAVWYLSSMLICMAILYPLLRKYKTTATRIVIPLITLFIFGYFAVQTNSIRLPFGWAGFTYRGNLRAFADLGIGVILYQITEVFKEKRLTLFSKVLLTIVKYAGVVSLVAYMYVIRKPTIQEDLFHILVIMLVIGLVFSNQTYGTRLFNNGVFRFLGKFSLPLYLSHYYWANILKVGLPDSFDKTKATIIYLILSVGTAALVMALSALIKTCKPFSGIKPLFVKEAPAELICIEDVSDALK